MNVQERRHLAKRLGQTGRLCENRNFGVDLKDKSGPVFRGYASTTGREYDMGWYVESVDHGAFTDTLRSSPDVLLLINHGETGFGLPVAGTRNGTLDLTEDDGGLAYTGRGNDDDEETMVVARKIDEGLLNQNSFAFRVVKQDWNDDYSKRTIQQVSLDRGDVSIVNNGANPDTPLAVSRAMRSFANTLRSVGNEDLMVEIRSELSPDEIEIAYAAFAQILERGAPVPSSTEEVREAVALAPTGYPLSLARARALALRTRL